jgi:hypothetical protein
MFYFKLFKKLSPASRNFKIAYINVPNIDEYLAISIDFIIDLKNGFTYVSSFGIINICCINKRLMNITNKVNDTIDIINIENSFV